MGNTGGSPSAGGYVVIILAALLSSACSRPEKRLTEVDASAPTPSESTVSFDSLPVVDASPPRRTKSFAMFDKKSAVLIACMDAVVFTAPSADAGASKKDPSFVPISKPCGEQFADRGALARCRETPFGDAGAGYYTVSYYDLDMLTKSDVEMRDCLRDGGDWSAEPKDSPIYLDAVRKRLRRNAEKAQHLLE